jgi:hypothetical protein
LNPFRLAGLLSQIDAQAEPLKMNTGLCPRQLHEHQAFSD